MESKVGIEILDHHFLSAAAKTTTAAHPLNVTRCQRLIRSMAAAHPLDDSNKSSTTIIINDDFHP